MSSSTKKDSLKKTAALVLQRLKKYEFGTFEVRADAEIKGAVSLAVENLLDAKKAQEKPDITIEISKKSGIEIKSNPLFLEGSFRILSEKILPSEKECAVCKGSGCSKCDYAGTTSGETAEKIVSEELVRLTDGTGYAFEQKGEKNGGYSFSIKIEAPKKRKIDIASAAARINKGKKILLETLDYAQ